MIDSYYTSPYLATRLVNHIKHLKFDNVIDFCIGDGELVRSAMKIWPNIKCYGTDISDTAIKEVKQKHPNWKLGKCDFLNKVSINRCQVIKRKKNGFDLVLLNPPFSCKGGTIHEVTLDNELFKVSTSMKFLAESIKFLSSKGCLLAIMPISVCYSQKDKKMWNYLVANYSLNILEIPNGNFFKNCSPSIVFISINIRNIINTKIVNRFSLDFSNYTIFRGKISVHDAKHNLNGLTFIHSTNLKNNSLENLSVKVETNTSIISGPAILLPRVGKPSSHKICLISGNSKYALSDCILAIQHTNYSEVKEMYNKLIENFDILKEQYKGTGAKFITVERLDQFLGLSHEISKEISIALPSGTLAKRAMQTLQPIFAKEPSIPSLNNTNRKTMQQK